MAAIVGNRTTLNTSATHRKPDIDNKLCRIEPENTPLTVLVKQMAKKVTTQPDFYHFEKALLAEEATVNNGGGYDASATSIVVDDETIIKPKDVLINPATLERMLVTAVDSATHALTVVRSIGDTAAGLIGDDAVLLRLGSAHEEGGDAAEAVSGDPEQKAGSVQIFKNAIKMTNTQRQTENYTEDDYAEAKREAGALHKLEIEKAFWFNDGGYYTGSDGRARLTDGVIAQITTNVLDAGGVLTEDEFDDFLEDIFRYGSSEKTCFASARLLSILNGWEKSRWIASDFGKKYGLPACTEYLNPHGKLNIINAREIFKGAVFGYYNVFLDLKYLKYRPLKGRDTAIEDVVTTKDALHEQFLTEAGLQFQNEKAHAILKNATTRG
jgi:hypothetical protein